MKNLFLWAHSYFWISSREVKITLGYYAVINDKICGKAK